MRERGFTIYSTAINIGAVAGPLATGSLANSRGFHAGFTLAAGLMLVALIIYLFGQRLLPEPPLGRADRPIEAPLSPAERSRSRAIAAVIALNIPTVISFQMIGGIGVIWIDDRIKLAIGFALQGASALLLTAGSLLPGADGKISVLWPLISFFGMGVAFMWYWPVSLALIAKAAPPKLAATLMGCCYLSLFFGTVAMGWVGSYYDQMSNAAFWTLDAAISLAGALLMVGLHRPIGRALDAADPPLEVAGQSDLASFAAA